MTIFNAKQELYKKNLNLLHKKYPSLAHRLDEIKENGLLREKYIVDVTKNGLYTLAIKHNFEKIQIHSRYDPVKEAISIVKSANIQNHKLLLLLGIGLGYHTCLCYEQFKNSIVHFFIIEPDIYIFRLCLEYVDISSLILADNVSFIVGLDEKSLYQHFYNLLLKLGAKIQLFLKAVKAIELPSLTRIYANYYHSVVASFRQAAETILINYGNCPKDALDGLSNIIANIPVIITNPGVNKAYGIFQNKPGILVSTGPSLDKNINELHKAVGKSVIVCADSALQVLYNHGIKPDLVASVERLPEVADLFKPIPAEWRSDIWLAALPLVVPEVYEVWTGPKLIVYRDFAHFEWVNIPKGSLPVGPSCANLGFQLLKAFECNPIILVGQDCAFKDIYKTHASGANGITKLDLSSAQLYKVKGNVEEWVYTDYIFDLYRKTFIVDIANYTGKCINATEGGAYIDGTVVMNLSDAIANYCNTCFNTKAIIWENVKYPSNNEIQNDLRKFIKVAESTIEEVVNIINLCIEGEKQISEYRKELQNVANSEILTLSTSEEIKNYIHKIPYYLIESYYNKILSIKYKILSFGKYFELFLMHILQPVIISYELTLNEIPVIYSSKQEQWFFSIAKMNDWFTKIKDICTLALKILKDGYEKIKKYNFTK